MDTAPTLKKKNNASHWTLKGIWAELLIGTIAGVIVGSCVYAVSMRVCSHGWAARNLLSARSQGSMQPFLTLKFPVPVQTPFTFHLIVSETDSRAPSAQAAD